MGILDGDIQILNNNAFPGREGHKPIAIILHGTASNGATTAIDIANFFASTQGTANPVSAHYIIDKDGTVVRCNSLADGAYGNGILEQGYDPLWDTLLNVQPDGSHINPNNVTISIEHVKFANDNSDTITEPQKAASFHLIDALCAIYDIPRQMIGPSGGITGHYSISPVSRARCPGPYPFDELIQYLNTRSGGESTMFDETSPLFAQHFRKISDNDWLCVDTGKHITLGMLAHYKTLSPDPAHQLPLPGLPLTNEIYIQRTDNAPLSHLICERAALIYDPQGVNEKGMPGQVYLGRIDSGIILAALQAPVVAQLAALEKQVSHNMLAALEQIDSIVHPIVSPPPTVPMAVVQPVQQPATTGSAAAPTVVKAPALTLPQTAPDTQAKAA